MTKIAVVLLADRDRPLAESLCAQLDEAVLHVSRRDMRPTEHAYESVTAHLQTLFQAGTSIAFIGSTGIAMRALAGSLGDKFNEPPVIVVAPDGQTVIPLLGGHRGGNDLARRLADVLGISPAITTAGDLAGLPILDAPPDGYACPDKRPAKALMQKMLNGETLQCAVSSHCRMPDWLVHDQLSPSEGDADIVVGIHEDKDAEHLVVHPRQLVIGVGCERFVEPERLISHVEQILKAHKLAADAVACVVSHELKAAEPAMHALAFHLKVPVRFLSGEMLLRQTDRLSTRSEIVFRETGCYGVSESAALSAVGASGQLLVNKVIGPGVTCAVAVADEPVNPSQVGRARGRLSVIGIGPGRPDWRTPDADHQIRLADDLVGYSYYLDLIEPLSAHQQRHDYALGEERKRCEVAVDLAATGRHVAMICSGDAGIYAMASLILEVYAAREDAASQRIELDFVPGVTAMQAASARIGAMLGHDFCAISLSDLMTPWHVIEQRVEAAGQGDFVVALYNPASLTRRQGLITTLARLREYRPDTTPVVLGRMLGRPEESLTVTTIAELDPDKVDMMTVVLIGSSQTRIADHGLGFRFVFTPRGYEVS